MIDEDCCSSSSKGEGGTFDLAVIGAGSAGFSAAITGAESGADVALIGHGVIGGTCVNLGCVPSKALIRAAHSLHQARAASRFSGTRAPIQELQADGAAGGVGEPSAIRRNSAARAIDENQRRSWLAFMVADEVRSANRSSCCSLIRFSISPRAQNRSS